MPVKRNAKDSTSIIICNMKVEVYLDIIKTLPSHGVPYPVDLFSIPSYQFDPKKCNNFFRVTDI